MITKTFLSGIFVVVDIIVFFFPQINEPLSLTINKPIASLINELTKIFSIKQVLKGRVESR